jgi:hypothetical protein
MSGGAGDRTLFTVLDYAGLGLILFSVEEPCRRLLIDDHPVSLHVIVGCVASLLLGALVLFISKRLNRPRPSSIQPDNSELLPLANYSASTSSFFELLVDWFESFVSFVISTVVWLVVGAFLLVLIVGPLLPSPEVKKTALDDPFAVTSDIMRRCASDDATEEKFGICVNDELAKEGRRWRYDSKGDSLNRVPAK